MGYIRGVIHGAVIGTVLGLAIAPQEGARTREQARVALERMRTGIDSVQETARRVAPQVREAAESASAIFDSVRVRVTHRGGEPGGIEIAGTPNGAARSPVDAGNPF